MNLIRENLYQFSQFRQEVNIATHQYLLMNSQPTLVYTGAHSAAKENLPELERLLDGRGLSYIFVSHLGGDECGGLSVILERYPRAKVLAAEHTARQLPGFGIEADYRIVEPGQHIVGEDFDYLFIEYPADPHLMPGALMYDSVSGVFFSSDLMRRTGNGAGEVTTSSWKDEVHATNIRQVPNRVLAHQLRADLMKISPRFIAVGHGYCMNV